jgi:hypothetical protein
MASLTSYLITFLILFDWVFPTIIQATPVNRNPPVAGFLLPFSGSNVVKRESSTPFWDPSNSPSPAEILKMSGASFGNWTAPRALNITISRQKLNGTKTLSVTDPDSETGNARDPEVIGLYCGSDAFKLSVETWKDSGAGDYFFEWEKIAMKTQQYSVIKDGAALCSNPIRVNT